MHEERGNEPHLDKGYGEEDEHSGAEAEFLQDGQDLDDSEKYQPAEDRHEAVRVAGEFVLVVRFFLNVLFFGRFGVRVFVVAHGSEQVEEGKYEDPHDVNVVPVEPEELQRVVVLRVVAAAVGLDNQVRQRDNADEDVRPVGAGGNVESAPLEAGVNPETVYKAIQGGLAGSNVINAKAPMIVDRNFNPGFRIELHYKDINNAMEAARDLDIPLQVTANLQQVLTALMIQGEGKSDHSALTKYVEKLAGIEIKKH